MSIGANRRADITNRRISVIVGIAFVILAALAWAAGWGAFTDRGSDVILSASARSSIDERIWIGWLAAVVIAVVVLVLALRWLRFELRPLPSHPDFEIELDEGLHLHVDADAWLDIVVADVEAVDGVTSTRARLHPDDDDALTIDLVLGVDERADPAALAQKLDEWVRKRAEHSLGRPVRLDAELSVGGRSAASGTRVV